ncbi:MAG: RNA-binding transcriptional accessory protein, partial [Oscillospiraceae bacterium]|nr:RNA-binding transcriptional accessory protein [Oscillospiraceae bacterium]
MPTIIETLARELGQKEAYVANVADLLDQGNTIPFIARYRKELHGAMDDQTIRTLADRLSYLRSLEARRGEVKSAVETQGKLTEELSAAIDAAQTLAEVEDLYRPYRPKRRTRASMARDKGLEPLAQEIFAQTAKTPPEALAAAYLDAEKGVETVEDALQGASDILAEQISDDADLRKRLRAQLTRQAVLRSRAAKEDEDSVYRLYYDFSQSVARLQSHQVLALNRGEKEGFLKVSLEADRAAVLQTLFRAVVRPGSAAMAFVRAAAEDAWDRLLAPSLERELRGALTEDACEAAIRNFALNLRPLLLQPPVKGRVTMGLDPGYRNGCKVAVVDGTGKVLGTAVVYPTFSQRKKEEAIDCLAALIRKHGVAHIAIGNGTASRETE